MRPASLSMRLGLSVSVMGAASAARQERPDRVAMSRDFMVTIRVNKIDQVKHYLCHSCNALIYRGVFNFPWSMCKIFRRPWGCTELPDGADAPPVVYA